MGNARCRPPIKENQMMSHASSRAVYLSVSALALCLAAAACGGLAPPGQTAPSRSGSLQALPGPGAPEGQANPDRNAYYGDLHVHTRYSFDAFLFGTTTSPDDAYRFAKGEAILHPSGIPLQIDRPLDFQAVTDHGMYLGMAAAMNQPGTGSYEHPMAEDIRNMDSVAERYAAFRGVGPYYARDQMGLADRETMGGAWADTIAAANRHYEPGRFTTFTGYEYTPAPGLGDNLHRNVIFAGDRVPAEPYSRMDSDNPEDLWHRMDAWREAGIDSLAIPHNSNASGGRMFERTYFDRTRPIDRAYAELRMRNEPIVEITQVKGTSEVHPALSPNDEWANFEIVPFKIASSVASGIEGSYVRDAYLRGLEFEEEGLPNPYAFGLIGSSDTHVSGGSFREEDYWGKTGFLDASRELRGSVPCKDDPDCEFLKRRDEVDLDQDGSGRRFTDNYTYLWGASGLAGVWAEENTREAIFAAMQRKETFATSGPRIRVRFFAVDGLSTDDLDRPDLISLAYANGVPMGGEFDDQGESGDPGFLVWAARDPLGAPLQRIQVVKGWMEGGERREEVYDVACSDGLEVDPVTHRCPDNGALVDIATCETPGTAGADELKVLWRDPDFSPGQRAFYYVRALENPTCRWSTWDALRTGVEPRYNVPATIQERAWSSPIWYRPAGR